jgi:hypothetical protein
VRAIQPSRLAFGSPERRLIRFESIPSQEWETTTPYHNNWLASTTIVRVDNATLPGGGFHLQTAIANAARDAMEVRIQWVGSILGFAFLTTFQKSKGLDWTPSKLDIRIWHSHLSYGIDLGPSRGSVATRQFGHYQCRAGCG